MTPVEYRARCLSAPSALLSQADAHVESASPQRFPRAKDDLAARGTGTSLRIGGVPAPSRHHARAAHAERAASGREIADDRGSREYHHRRSEEHTSELQSLMRSTYVAFCLTIQ